MNDTSFKFDVTKKLFYFNPKFFLNMVKQYKRKIYMKIYIVKIISFMNNKFNV